MCWLSWFLDPGGWSKTAAVRLYFIFPGICTLSLRLKVLIIQVVCYFSECYHKTLGWSKYSFNTQPNLYSTFSQPTRVTPTCTRQHQSILKSVDLGTRHSKAFAYLGVPNLIKTDNGTAYASQGFQKFCKRWSIQHKTGIPYNPQDAERPVWLPECYVHPVDVPIDTKDHADYPDSTNIGTGAMDVGWNLPSSAFCKAGFVDRLGLFMVSQISWTFCFMTFLDLVFSLTDESISSIDSLRLAQCFAVNLCICFYQLLDESFMMTIRVVTNLITVE
ncbi:hypothetical protein STEG23_001546, partial [Scotinomys teguina]